ncbi:MAG TPA: hypothetical protein VH143_20715 [Kofleriaceae bacterium]|jgi:hypothetical protein|nr:hypothetical protein [Kofleriaceae bacterium]
MTNEDETSSRVAANMWWQPHPAMAAMAASPAASRAFALRSSSPLATLIVALLGLVFSPFGIAAWIWAGSQLKAIELGTMRCDHRAVLVIAKVLGVVVTVAMITGIIIVLALSR